MSNQYLDILLHDSSYGEYNEYVNLEKHQKHSMFILGGLAAALLLVSKKWGGFHGSYNDDEENQYEKALRMMRQAKQKNATSGEEVIRIKRLIQKVNDAAGHTTGHIASSDEMDYDRSPDLVSNMINSNWERQERYWDSLSASGKAKTNLDTIEGNIDSTEKINLGLRPFVPNADGSEPPGTIYFQRDED
jgi:hypothetical protein